MPTGRHQTNAPRQLQAIRPNDAMKMGTKRSHGFDDFDSECSSSMACSDTSTQEREPWTIASVGFSVPLRGRWPQIHGCRIPKGPSASVSSRSFAARHPKTWLLQLPVSKRLENLVQLTRHTMDDGEPDLLAVSEELRTQSAANEGPHTSLSQKLQSIERGEASDLHFLAKLDAVQTLSGKNADPGTPVEDRGYARAQHGNSQLELHSVHGVSGSCRVYWFSEEAFTRSRPITSTGMNGC